MPKVIAFVLAGTMLVACNRGPIIIAEYAIPFDSRYKLLHEKNDTNLGVIRRRDMRVYYSYGQGDAGLPKTKEEYLANGEWKDSAYTNVTSPGDAAYKTYEAKDIKLVATRPPVSQQEAILYHNAELIATCKLGDKTFLYGIAFPKTTYNYRFLTDTIDGHYRKIVIANNPKTGITAVYLTNPDKQQYYLNMPYWSLMLAADSITHEQQDSLVRVFKRISIFKERM